MWKKAKRILSCVLALIMLLSIANGQQFFVQAENEETARMQTKEVENKTAETEVTASKSESKESDTNKDENKKEDSSVKSTEKSTEKTTESGKEEEKSDKPAKSDKDSESTTSEDADIKKENKDESESSKDDKSEEETTQEVADEEKITEEESAEKTTEGIEETEEAPEIATTESETETVGETDSADAKKVTDKMKEYVPQEQPEEINVKAYAKEGVFPEETIMKVRKINKEEKAQAESVLKKEVEYDGFLGYDISFYDKDGKEIEPEAGSVKVSMQLKEKVFSDEVDKETLTVQHLDDSKTTLDVQQVASAANGTVEMQSGKMTAEYTVNSFSVFTITWKNNSTEVASLTANCIDTDGNAVKIQYDNQKATGTINESSVTYDANKEIITEVSDVSTLAPTVQNATFLKAVVAANANAAKQGGTEIYYIRLGSSSEGWQYYSNKTDKENWVSIGDSKLYYIYSKNTITDSADSISFAYYGVDEINDMHSIAARDTVKFTISLVDENGNNETYKLPEGSVIPDKYTFHSSSVHMNAASFAQMGIVVPGYTYEGGYAYFYWNGNFTGKKFSVSNFKNLGANSTKYGKGYDSYIGYTGTHPDGAHAGYDDYSKDTFGDRGKDYYAYNPTGTLRIVFKKVSSTVAYKSNFVDAYKNDTYRLIAEKAMKMHQDGSSTEFYGTLNEIPAENEEPTKEGYTFEGWYMEKDADGNGTGTKITKPSDDTNTYTQDAYYYAKWVPNTYNLSIKKIVDTSGENNMGDRNKEFSFKLSLKKDNKAYDEEIEGLTKTKAGEYSFTLKHNQTKTVSLPYKADYEISENADDYTVQIEAPEGATKNLDAKKVSGTIDSDKSIVFTNKKTVIPPTGVNNTMTAWFLMTGATLFFGAIFILFNIRRKRLMA